MSRGSARTTFCLAMAALSMAAARVASAQTGACCGLPPPIECQDGMTAADCALAGGIYQGDLSECGGPTGCTITTYEAGVGGAPDGGQVNISGATLFQDFFLAPGSTNDFSNPDGDTVARPPPCNDVVPFAGFIDTDCDGFADSVDQLAASYTCPSWTGYWLVQYRAVGSVEGLEEFITTQLTGVRPQPVPSDRGIANRRNWALAGAHVAGCPVADEDADGDVSAADETGTPVLPDNIDIASVDVPTSWAVQGGGTGSNADWSRKPEDVGYGRNPKTSTTGFPNTLASLDRPPFGSLNTNLAAPDGNTVYDNVVSWSPVVPIANRGVGIENIRYTELQHLFVAGRLPNGENIVVNVRDVGSGTRNTWSNGIGVDPSHCVGDHVGPRIPSNTEANIGVVPVPPPGTVFALAPGSRTQPTNCGGSGVTETAVRSWRLCLGFTGLFGPGRAAADAVAGQYEILNVCKDIDGDGDTLADSDCTPDACNSGGPAPVCVSGPGFDPSLVPDELAPANSGYVRPGTYTVLDNDNPRCGYQIGAAQTLATRGDPEAGFTTVNPAMTNVNARDYIRNITTSIAAFVGNPPANTNFNMPGELLATSFALVASVDALPFDNNPTDLRGGANHPGFSQFTQDYTRCFQVTTVPAWGSVNVAGLVPVRNNRSTVGGTYSDGNVNGSYTGATVGVYDVTSSFRVNQRNRVAGDMNYDGLRNADDIAQLMLAVKDPRAYQSAEVAAPPPGLGGTGPLAANFVVPEIIADFDGDGNFDAGDVRYFGDGLAIATSGPNTGKLDRRAGFVAIDEEWDLLMPGDNNYFNTVLATCKPYSAGDSRGDVAGNPASPGGRPSGSDGVVNGDDIDYVYANFGDWSDLDQAANFDLSADINGDLVVSSLDVDELVRGILCTEYGDANLDGVVNAADVAIVNSGALPRPGGWADGDFDGDGLVTATDLATASSSCFRSLCCVALAADINGDLAQNSTDVTTFRNVLLGTDMTPLHVQNSDLNGDCTVDGDDINPFLDAYIP